METVYTQTFKTNRRFPVRNVINKLNSMNLPANRTLFSATFATTAGTVPVQENYTIK